MLAGRTPFGGSNAFEIALKHVRAEPDLLESIRPDLPPALCAVVRKVMAKNPDDRLENEQALLDNCRLLSAYRLGDGTRIWIITEADRSSTTILLPEEY